MSDKTNGLDKLSFSEVKEFLNHHFPDALNEQAKEEIKAEKAEERPRRIVIATLAYDARMHCRHAFSLLQAGFQVAREGWELSFVLREGDSMVARGRNVLCAKFMEDPANTDLFLVDTDLEFNADDFIRMCKHPVDVVAAAYPYKDDSGQMPLRWPVEGLFEENGLWVVQAATPGFMRITRKALDLMQRQLPHLAFHDNALGPQGRNWMFFDNACRPNGVYDEGYIFCEKWAQCGGKVYLDPNCNITHIGIKAYNHGSAVDWLNRTAKNTAKLKHEFPHVPDLDLVGFGAAKKINWEAAREKYGKADDQRNNEGASGTAQENGGAYGPEDDATEHDSNDLSRHGRSTDPGLAKAIAQRFADISVGITERGLPGGEVR